MLFCFCKIVDPMWEAGLVVLFGFFIAKDYMLCLKLTMKQRNLAKYIKHRQNCIYETFLILELTAYGVHIILYWTPKNDCEFLYSMLLLHSIAHFNQAIASTKAFQSIIYNIFKFITLCIFLYDIVHTTKYSSKANLHSSEKIWENERNLSSRVWVTKISKNYY